MFVPCTVYLIDLFTQGDSRTYNYVVALSSMTAKEVNWEDVAHLAKLIPRVCHNVNR